MEGFPGAITLSVIALLPLTALAVWGGARMRFFIATVVCVNVGIWGGLFTFIDASWHGRFSGSDIAKLAACIAAIGLGRLAYNAAKRRLQGEVKQRHTAPAILSLLWLFFFGAVAGESWRRLYNDHREARLAQPKAWPDALRASLTGAQRRWNKQRPEAHVETLLSFGDPVRSPDRVVVWAVLPGPAMDSLPIIDHLAMALVTELHHWQREKGFPCVSDFGIVSAGTLEAMGREQFFGDDGRQTPPQATYENRFNFYRVADTSARGPRCQFPSPTQVSARER